MNKSIVLAVTLAAVFGVSLVANAACRSADAPASTAPSPAPASVLSPAPTFAPPPNAKPVEPPTSDEPQHFCCDEVGEGKKGKGDGTNCTAINKELINQCTELLFCSGNYYRKKGDVTCLQSLGKMRIGCCSSAAFLAGHPAVREVAVLGVPDPNVCDELPRNALGKLQKHLLREAIARAGLHAEL